MGMSRRVHPFWGLCAAIVLSLSAVHTGLMAGQPRAVGVMVLCRGGGIVAVAVAVDADGAPVAATPPCPDCVPAMPGLPGPEASACARPVGHAAAFVQFTRQSARLHPPAAHPARGPPAVS